MARRILIVSLALAGLLELALTVGGFVAPGMLLEAFKVGGSSDTFFLGDVIAWLLMAVTVMCALSLRWVLAGKSVGWSMALILGVWWVGIGLDLALRFGSMPNLVLDSLKGAVIATSAWLSRPRA